MQPHSGAQANQAVFLALLQARRHLPGHGPRPGGHLTHGSPANQSGKWFKAVPYGVRPTTHLIDYDAGGRGWRVASKPKLIIAGGSAYPRHIDFARFRKIADEVGAFFMVDMAHFRRPGRRRRLSRARCRTPMSSPRRRTRRCAARAAA